MTEFPELQNGLHGHSYESEDDSEDTYPLRKDNPAGIGNDDGGRLSSDSDYDDDDVDSVWGWGFVLRRQQRRRSDACALVVNKNKNIYIKNKIA